MARARLIHYHKNQSDSRGYWDYDTICNRKGTWRYQFTSNINSVTCAGCIKAMKKKGLFGEDEVYVDDDTESYLSRLGVQDYTTERDWHF